MGKGKDTAFLVLGPNYSVLGLATDENAACKNFEGPITVVGPLPFNEEVDWELTTEGKFDSRHGRVMDYVNMHDGVPVQADKGYVQDVADVRYRASLK